MAPQPSNSEKLLERLLAALPDDLETLRELCTGAKDWGAIFKSAERNGIAAILYHYLTQLQLPLPPDVESAIKRQLTLDWLLQLRLRAALDEAVAALQAAGVRTVALKGPLIAERLYPEEFLRSSSDVDLMVALADLDCAQAALEGIGYQPETGVLARFFRENHHHLHFNRSQTPPLELHFRASTGFGNVVPSEEMIDRAVPYSTAAGRTIRVLAPEDEVLYLALHGARHLFSELIWLYDLKLLLERNPDLDWSVIWARAGAIHITNALSLTFAVLHDRLGVALPRASSSPPRHRLRRWLARTVVLGLVNSQPVSSRRETAGRFLFRALLCDSPASSAWHFRHRLLRFVRRRAQRYFPRLAPEKWSA